MISCILEENVWQKFTYFFLSSLHLSISSCVLRTILNLPTSCVYYIKALNTIIINKNMCKQKICKNKHTQVKPNNTPHQIQKLHNLTNFSVRNCQLMNVCISTLKQEENIKLILILG